MIAFECSGLKICVNALQQIKDKVKLLIQLADNLVEKGHAHVSELKRWVSTVDRRYRDFSLRLAKYQESLERSLGVSSEVQPHYSVKSAYHHFISVSILLDLYSVTFLLFSYRIIKTWNLTSFRPA